MPYYFHGKAFIGSGILSGGLLPALSFQREGFCLTSHFWTGKGFLSEGLLSVANLFLFPKFTYCRQSFHFINSKYKFFD
jgi:hypothetical protein